MTEAEWNVLSQNDHLGDFRLSCQISVEDDITVIPLKRVKDMDWDEPGARPEEQITPEPKWMTAP